MKKSVLFTIMWSIVLIMPLVSIKLNIDPQHHWVRIFNIIYFGGMIYWSWTPERKYSQITTMLGGLLIILLNTLWLTGTI